MRRVRENNVYVPRINVSALHKSVVVFPCDCVRLHMRRTCPSILCPVQKSVAVEKFNETTFS